MEWAATRAAPTNENVRKLAGAGLLTVGCDSYPDGRAYRGGVCLAETRALLDLGRAEARTPVEAGKKFKVDTRISL